MRTIHIESAKNAEYKRLLTLKNAARARKEGVFLLEGERAVRELPADWSVESLWIQNGYSGSLPEVLQRTEKAFLLPPALFQKAAETVHSQGVLAVVCRKTFALKDMAADSGFWVILENLQDPGNAGTILRTADACGANGVICTKGTVDLYNAKVIRSCMGSIFHIPFVEDADLQDVREHMKAKWIGTHLSATQSYDASDYTGPTAILIGNEGGGLSDEAVSLCDELVRIPMPGRAESLNASVACGVMMYEVLRQRK